MSNNPKDECESLDRSASDVANGSQIFNLSSCTAAEMLEQSMDLPTFEFSSPISSIGSNNSSPERTERAEQTIQPQRRAEFSDDDSEEDDFVSIEELKCQISPPSDDEDCSGFNLTRPAVEVLETIFEDCYLETPPGTPTTPRRKKPRRVRMKLSISFEEFKENVQDNQKSEDNWAIPTIAINFNTFICHLCKKELMDTCTWCVSKRNI